MRRSGQLSDVCSACVKRRSGGGHGKYCRIVRRTLNGVKRWFVQLVFEGLPPVRKVYAPKCEVVGIDPGPSRIA